MSDKYLEIAGFSNTNDESLVAVFLADNTGLTQLGTNEAAWDAKGEIVKSIEDGRWLNTPLDVKHEIYENKRMNNISFEEAVKKSKIYGKLIDTFAIKDDYVGYVNNFGNKVEVINDEFYKKIEADTGKKPIPYYGIYKLNEEGVKLFKAIRERGFEVKASSAYEVKGEFMKSRSLGGIRYVDEITPVSNSIVPAPALKGEYNAVSVNSEKNENENLLDNSFNSFFENEKKMSDCDKTNGVSANGTELPYPVRPTVRLLIDKINVLPEDKITLISKFIDDGFSCVSKNDETPTNDVKPEGAEQKAVGIDIAEKLKELDEKREADKLEIIDLIKGLKGNSVNQEGDKKGDGTSVNGDDNKKNGDNNNSVNGDDANMKGDDEKDGKKGDDNKGVSVNGETKRARVFFSY